MNQSLPYLLQLPVPKNANRIVMQAQLCNIPLQRLLNSSIFSPPFTNHKGITNSKITVKYITQN